MPPGCTGRNRIFPPASSSRRPLRLLPSFSFSFPFLFLFRVLYIHGGFLVGPFSPFLSFLVCLSVCLSRHSFSSLDLYTYTYRHQATRRLSLLYHPTYLTLPYLTHLPLLQNNDLRPAPTNLNSLHEPPPKYYNYTITTTSTPTTHHRSPFDALSVLWNCPGNSLRLAPLRKTPPAKPPWHCLSCFHTFYTALQTAAPAAPPQAPTQPFTFLEAASVSLLPGCRGRGKPPPNLL
jgi:hypothetical protein